MQISQNLLSNPVVSQSRACSLGVNGMLGTSMDGAGYPWGTSLAISWPGQGLNQDTKGEEWNPTVLFYADCDFRPDNERVLTGKIFPLRIYLALDMKYLLWKPEWKLFKWYTLKINIKINKHFIPAECRIVFFVEKQLYQFCDWGLGDRVQQQRGCLILLSLFIPAGMTMPTSFKAGL